jgi:hypothetical protein
MDDNRRHVAALKARTCPRNSTNAHQAFPRTDDPTRGRGLANSPREVEKWVAENKFKDGLLTLHLQHTSASLLIQENADPDVRRDLDAFFKRLVPDGDPLFIHTPRATTTCPRTSAPR